MSTGVRTKHSISSYMIQIVHTCGLQACTQTEVTQLDMSIAIEEEIIGFDVTVVTESEIILEV